VEIHVNEDLMEKLKSEGSLEGENCAIKDIWYVSDIFYRKIFPTSSIWRVFRDKFWIFFCVNFTQVRLWSSIA
jgi:hypothetical protein